MKAKLLVLSFFLIIIFWESELQRLVGKRTGPGVSLSFKIYASDLVLRY